MSTASWIILASLVVSALATVIAIVSLSTSKSNAARLTDAENTRNDPAGHPAPEDQEPARPAAPEPESAAVDPWLLTWESGSAYRLANNRAEDAADVELVTRDGGPILVDQGRRDIAAGGSITFAASIYVGMTDHQITVTWYRPDGELKAWRAELPA